VADLGIDLAALSAHKVYGPKGTGALVARRRGGAVPLDPVLFGGGQEGGLRPGTLNVPAIAGFGEACEIAGAEGAESAVAMRDLRDRLHHRILEGLPHARLNGCPEFRHPGNLNLSIDGVSGEALLGALPDVAYSGGSACASGSRRPSHVMAAIGRANPEAAVVRFGLGRSTTADEIEYVARRLVEVVTRLRPVSRAPALA
jgi:cysteine desulfurase